MTRHLAHMIILNGHSYPMAVAEISDDRRSCKIAQFTEEIHSTRFHNGEIEIRKNPEGLYVVMEGRHRAEGRVRDK